MMNTRILLTLSILLLLLIPPTVAQDEPPPCTLYVAPDGNDANAGTDTEPLASVTQGVARAAAGDVVCVLAGDYTLADGGVWIASSGAEGAPIMVQALGDATLHGEIVFQPGAAYWQLDGFTITDYLVWGITLAGGNTDIELSNLEIYGGDNGLRMTVGDSGEEAYNGPVDRVTLRDVVIHDTIYASVDCTPGPCNDLVMQRVESYHAGAGEQGYAADGLSIERGHNILIEDCYMHDNGGDGIDLNSRDVGQDDVGQIIVRRNRVFNNQREGIKVWAGGMIANNLVWNSGTSNLVIEEGGDYTIVNNTFASLQQYSYLVTLGYDPGPSPTNVAFYNNVVYNDNPTMGGVLMFVTSRATFEGGNNLFYNPFREDEVVCLGEDVCYSATDIDDGALGAGTVYGDPLFRDPTNGDFQVAMYSPIINGGLAEFAPEDDLLGVMRSDLPDIGAYEFVVAEPE